MAVLQGLRHGALTVHLPDGNSLQCGRWDPHVEVRLANWQPLLRALRSGGVGFAQSYVAGEWSTTALPELLGLVLRNRDALEEVLHGSWWGRLAGRAQQIWGRRPLSPSAYDLEQSFYQLWLDPSMNCSAACFDGMYAQSLEQAQGVKMRRVLDMARVQPGQRVLEIGCGWSGLSGMAAGEFRADYTGTTLYGHRLAYARRRLADAGLARYCDVRLQHWRTLEDAPFDAVCSIETLETVGRAAWPRYFATLRRMLKPGGHACIQTTVLADRLWDRYARHDDSLRDAIFPGSCLISRNEFHRAATAAGLRVVDASAFGADYAETLRRWRERFLRNAEGVRALGFDDGLLRLWDFYLAYCEAAFAERNTDVVQYVLRHA